MSMIGEKLIAGTALSVIIGIGATACSSEESSNPGGGYVGGGVAPAEQPTSAISDQVNEAIAELAMYRIRLDGMVDVNACNAVQRSVDTDCDGTVNSLDLSPMAKDFIDTDGDFITDYFDLYPGRDDWGYDIDGDTVIDAFDQYGNLNDLVDADGDGLLNINDAAPNTPQSSSTELQDYRAMQNNVAYYAQMNEQMKTFLEFDPSSTIANSTDLYKDSDRDGTFDVDDSYANDYNRGGETDPWKPGTDAFYDDENNGWDSDY